MWDERYRAAGQGRRNRVMNKCYSSSPLITVGVKERLLPPTSRTPRSAGANNDMFLCRQRQMMDLGKQTTASGASERFRLGKIESSQFFLVGNKRQWMTNFDPRLKQALTGTTCEAFHSGEENFVHPLSFAPG